MAVTWTFGDYFRTFGVPIVRGRGFLPEEDLENRGTAIVSRALAERYWPGQDPIGKRVKWGIAASRAPWQTVVGVAGDVVDGKLAEPPIMHIYVPFAEAVNPPGGLPIAGLVRRMTWRQSPIRTPRHSSLQCELRSLRSIQRWQWPRSRRWRR